MDAIDADVNSIEDLIVDCIDIPHTVLAKHVVPPRQCTAADWTVDDATVAQVIDLDEFV